MLLTHKDKKRPLLGASLRPLWLAALFGNNWGTSTRNRSGRRPLAPLWGGRLQQVCCEHNKNAVTDQCSR